MIEISLIFYFSQSIFIRDFKSESKSICFFRKTMRSKFLQR